MRRLLNHARLLGISSVLVLGLLLPFANAWGSSTRLVNATTGADTGDCISSPCATIQYAVDQAGSGDTVTVSAGTYAGDVNVNKSLALVGAQVGVNPNDGSWADTRTNAAAESTIHGALNLSLQNDISVDGFTFERTETNEGHILIGAGAPTGLGLTSSFDIQNNRFVGTRTNATRWAGIHTNFLEDITNVLPGNQFTATQNRFQISGTGSGAGILVNGNRPGSDGLGSTTITDNFVTGSPSNGLNVNRPGASLTLTGNYLVNDDIFTFKAHDALISNNTVINSPQGSIQVTASDFEDTSDITVSDNVITNDVSLLTNNFSQVDIRGPLSGTNIVTGNSVTLSGTPTGSVVGIYGVRVRDTGNTTSAGVDNLTVSSNTLNGGNVGGLGNVTAPPTSGVYLDTDFLTSSLDLHVENNFINGWVNGVSVFDSAPGGFGGLATDATAEFFENDFSGNSGLGVASGAGETIDASANWWGTNSAAALAALMAGPVDYTPWLDAGTDVGGDPADGFQGDFSTLNVDDDGEQVGTTGRIQEGVDLVDGSTVNVAAGTYDEQVVIDGKSLTLQGAGNTTVIAPSLASVLTSIYTTGTQSGAFFNTTAIAAIVDVRNVGAAGVTIQDLKIDGEGITSLPTGATWVSGILLGETGGTIDDVTVEDTKFVVPASVRTYGIWLDAVGGTAVNVNVTDSTVAQYGRNGINARGDDITVLIDNNTVTGPGMVGPDQVPNGVLLIDGALGTVSENTITANHYTGTTFLGSGILLFRAGDNIVISDNDVSDVDDAVLINATDFAMVTDNNLSDNVKGVRIEAGSASNNTFSGNTINDNSLFGIELSDTAGTGNVAHRNSIAGNTDGVSNGSTNAFDAECNWYGDATGPSGSGPGTGDSVSANVDFDPWLINSDLDYLCPVLPDITVSSSGGHSFGSQDIASGATAPFTFTVTNDGEADLAISAVTIVGVNAGHFGIDSDNCGDQTLVPAASCTIDVIFDPLTTGAKSASLRIASDDPDENPLNRALSGTGTTGPTTGTIEIVLNAVPNSFQNFAFTGDTGSFVLDDDANATLSNSRTVTLSPGTYDVTQGAVAGWSLTGLACNTGETTSLATRTATIDLAAGESVVCTFTNSRRLVDALISKQASSGYRGNNIYSSNVRASQTQSRAIARGRTRKFFVLVQNASFATDSFTVGATLTGSNSFSVKFFRGSTEITAAVLAGTYTINNLASAGEVIIEVRVTAAANTAANATRNVDVRLTSNSEPSVQDVVRGHVTRA